MSNTKQIIILTPCHFFLTGLTELLKKTHLPINLIPATSPEEVIAITKSVNTAMIVMTQESKSPAETARVHIQLQYIHRLMIIGVIPLTPCLLLTPELTVNIEGTLFQRKRENLLHHLETSIGEILVNSEKYKNMTFQRPVSNRQMYILRGIQKGMTVNQLAEQMNISPKTVFVHQNALIRKLKLRNRIELITLISQVATDVVFN